MARQGVAVVGGGNWGVALASAAARVGGDVALVTRREVPEAPRGVRVTTEVASAADAELVVLAVPSSAGHRSRSSRSS